MNFPNAAVLHQEVIKFLYFLQTIAPIQLNSLWQYVQFEDKEQKWTPAQLISIAEKSSPAQLEQLMCLTAANKRLDTDSTAETKQQLEALARDLSIPSVQLECFGSLFQMFSLQELLHSFSFVQLLKFFEVIPSGSQRQQLHLIQQLQQLFTQLTPETLDSLHQEVQEAAPEVEMTLLSHTLHLQPEHFHLYQPIRSLLHMETHELRSFQDALPKLQPIQMLQLLQLLQQQPYDVIELKKVFYQNQSSSNIVDPPFEFEPRAFSPSAMDEGEDADDQLVQAQKPTIGLQIVDQPPEKAVYKRNVKPNPSVQLVGEHMGIREGELYVVPLLLRCDTFAEEPRFITGNKPMPITFGRVVTFRKLKVMVTSHQQQETLFSFRFELRRKIGEDEYEVIGSVTTNPICMLSHSTQMKPIQTTAPTIMEVIPGIGPATGGTRVAILGGNFADTPATRVRFDNSDVIPEFRGPGTLVCHTPQHTPGPVLVRVANGPNAWSEGACTFTYATVARAHAPHAASAVPSNMFPTSAHFFDPSASQQQSSMHGFNFAMDISGISVGGGMVDALDQVGYAPLHYAAACGGFDLVRQLLVKGAHVQVQDTKGNTAIHWAVAFSQFQTVALLLSQVSRHSNPVNISNLNGRTALHWAAAIGSLQMVALLVEAGGALVNEMDEDGATPLHAASALGNTDIVKYLISRGGFLCSEDEVGDTPLHWAIREGHESVVRVLLEAQISSQTQAAPSIQEQPPHMYTPTGLFVSSQGITLLPLQAHPNEDGETPLHLAACAASASMVYTLLQHGAPPNLQDSTGWTPLHHAAAAGYDAVVRVFVDAYARARASSQQDVRGWGPVDLNCLDWEGNSPLHLACQVKSQEVACRLLFAGADPHARDRQGVTALQQSRAVGMKVDEFMQHQNLAQSQDYNIQNKQNDPKFQPAQESYFQHFQHLIGADRSPFVRSVMDWLGRTLKGSGGVPTDEGGGGGGKVYMPSHGEISF
jgi:ankyrin repeat protein